MSGECNIEFEYGAIPAPQIPLMPMPQLADVGWIELRIDQLRKALLTSHT